MLYRNLKDPSKEESDYQLLSQIHDPVLVIDPSAAGVSGDMFVAAILDLGANQSKVCDAMLAVRKNIKGTSNLRIGFQRVRNGGFTALKLEIQVKEVADERSGRELTAALSATLLTLSLSKGAVHFAQNALSTLIDVEGKLHGQNSHAIHLHEAGSIDTLLDIVGTAAGLDDLGMFNEKLEMVCTPIAVGGGTFTFSHGRVSSPAPATLEIARRFGLNIVGGPIKEELATPTGLAILANLADRSVPFYPAIKPLRIALGAGNKEFKEVPNILRLVLGEKIPGSKKEEKLRRRFENGGRALRCYEDSLSAS